MVEYAWVIIHYDTQLLLNMAAGAPAYGIGVVISHTFLDGPERPSAFALCSFTASEKNYVQVAKENFALIFVVKSFDVCLYGR